MDKTSGKRQHIVSDVVQRIIESSDRSDPVELTEEIMEALEEMRLVSYQKEGTLPLLSVAGRTLLLVAEHPDMTLREISVRMGVNETNVHRAITALAEAGLIRRERFGRRNQYAVNYEELVQHPDFWRPLVAINESNPAVMTDLP